MSDAHDQESIRLRTWGPQVRVLPGAPPSREGLADLVLRGLHARRDAATVHAVAGLVDPLATTRAYHSGWALHADGNGARAAVVTYLRRARYARALVEVPVEVAPGGTWTTGQAHVDRIQWDEAGPWISIESRPPVEVLAAELADLGELVDSYLDGKLDFGGGAW